MPLMASPSKSRICGENQKTKVGENQSPGTIGQENENSQN